MAEHFGRIPFASSGDTDYIPAVVYPDERCDPNTPDSEVKDVATYLKEKQDARRRGIAIDWNPETGEILVLAFYNNFTVDTLKKTLAEAQERYGKDAVRQMAISLAVEEARERRFDLHRWGFEKVEGRCNARYWIFVKRLGQKRVKSPIVVQEEKPEPKVELKFTLSVDELAKKQDELDALRLKIRELEEQ